MIAVSVVRPDAPGAREGKRFVQHLHARIIRSDHFRLEQDLFGLSVQRSEQIRALRQPVAHGLTGDVRAVAFEDLLLPV